MVSKQGNIRAWTRNLKKKINIDRFNFITWIGQMCDIYMLIYFLITAISPGKNRSVLYWIILILAVGNSLKLHIFELSQFRPDLIVPSTSALGGLVRRVCRFLQPWRLLNHWAIKVPERPSRLRLAGSLHYSPLFEIRAPWLGPLSTKGGSFHSQANPGYRCHQCNGPCGDRNPRSLAPESKA